MNILVKLYQAFSTSDVIRTMKSRMLGWAGDKKSFIFKEDNNSEMGNPRIIPSLEGDGLYSTITVPANTFVTGDLVRITSAGILSAASTSDNSKNATPRV